LLEVGSVEEAAVLVSLSEQGADDARLDTLGRQLRDELRQLDVRDVRAAPADAQPPPGSRGIDVASVGQLMVALVGTQGLSRSSSLCGAGSTRTTAPRRSRVELDGDVLELSGASDEEQDRLVEMFLSRHNEKGQSWTAGAQP
jgi:hypothetical protein